MISENEQNASPQPFRERLTTHVSECGESVNVLDVNVPNVAVPRVHAASDDGVLDPQKEIHHGSADGPTLPGVGEQNHPRAKCRG